MKTPLHTEKEIKVYRTTVTIWTAYDPEKMYLSTLAVQAEGGDAIATDWDVDEVSNSELPEAVASFFNVLDEDEDAEN